MEKEFSKEGEDKHVLNNYKDQPYTGNRIHSYTKVLNRNIIRMVVKKVCASCNNGWMSKIEADSKEIIKSLILDEPILLESNEQDKLSRWGVLKSIVGEYTNYESVKVVISKEERLNFFQTKALSQNFKVFIGRNLAKENFWKSPVFIHISSYLNTHGFTFYSQPDPNVQWSLFVKNTFVMLVYWGKHQVDLILPPPIIDKLVQIHPVTNDSFNSSSIIPLSEVEMDYMRKNLPNHSFAAVDK